jgi:hypothetical protein
MPAWLEAPCKRTQIFLFEGSQLFALLTAEGTGEGLDSVTPPSTPFLAKTVLSEPLEPSERRRNQSDEESTFVGGAAEMHGALDAETLSFVPRRTGTNSWIRCIRVIGKRMKVIQRPPPTARPLRLLMKQVSNSHSLDHPRAVKLGRTETPASLLADAFAISARVAGPPALSLVSTYIFSATQRSDYCIPSHTKTAN